MWHCATSSGKQPRLWMASTQKSTPRSRHRRPSVGRSLRAPLPNSTEESASRRVRGWRERLFDALERAARRRGRAASRSRRRADAGSTRRTRSRDTRDRRSRRDRRAASRAPRRPGRGPRWCSSRRRSRRGPRRSARRRARARARSRRRSCARSRRRPVRRLRAVARERFRDARRDRRDARVIQVGERLRHREEAARALPSHRGAAARPGGGRAARRRGRRRAPCCAVRLAARARRPTSPTPAASSRLASARETLARERAATAACRAKHRAERRARWRRSGSHAAGGVPGPLGGGRRDHDRAHGERREHAAPNAAQRGVELRGADGCPGSRRRGSGRG